MKHDYDKVIKKRNIADKTILILDQYQREQDYRKKRDSTVKFNIDDEISHPKFGKGIIEQIEQLEGSVRLHMPCFFQSHLLFPLATHRLLQVPA